MTQTPTDYLPIAVEDRLETATFDELAEVITSSLGSAQRHAKQTLEDLLLAGAALQQMKNRMTGKYSLWLAEQNIQEHQASRLLRLYNYRDHLSTADLQKPAGGLQAALIPLRHLPGLWNTQVGNRKKTPELMASVRAMQADGASFNTIADVIGINRRTLHGWLHPEGITEARKREKIAAERKRHAESALRRETARKARDAYAAATNDKNKALAYSHVRKALAALANAPTNVNARRAEDYLIAAENAIVRAMREEDGSPSDIGDIRTQRASSFAGLKENQ